MIGLSLSAALWFLLVLDGVQYVTPKLKVRGVIDSHSFLIDAQI